MKHTPGPWEVQGSTVFAVNETERVDGYRVGIAQCGGELTPRAGFKYGDERDANAKLIASAPALLAACRIALDTARCADWPDDCGCSAALIRAIHLATGKEG